MDHDSNLGLTSFSTQIERKTQAWPYLKIISIFAPTVMPQTFTESLYFSQALDHHLATL